MPGMEFVKPHTLENSSLVSGLLLPKVYQSLCSPFKHITISEPSTFILSVISDACSHSLRWLYWCQRLAVCSDNLEGLHCWLFLTMVHHWCRLCLPTLVTRALWGFVAGCSLDWHLLMTMPPHKSHCGTPFKSFAVKSSSPSHSPTANRYVPSVVLRGVTGIGSFRAHNRLGAVKPIYSLDK